MRPHRRVLVVLIALLSIPLPAQVDGSRPAKDLEAVEQIDRTLKKLYAAFSFAPGESFNRERLDPFFMPNAGFVQPAASNATRQIDNIDKFYSDFEIFVESARVQELGIEETILHSRTDFYGDIAHSYVIFQPSFGDEVNPPNSRGMDSFQLIKSAGTWRVASMTTKFESDEQSIPERFLR